MRADRLLAILFQLQVHRRRTARELAERLEVSERTIYRDMEALGAAGVPVVAERGAGGGWSLLEPYRTNLTGLNHDEVRSLFLAAPGRVLSDLGLRSAGEVALSKLLAAIPEVSRRDAEFARQRIFVDPGGWRSSTDDVSALPTLQDAIWRDRRVRFLYTKEAMCTGERLVEPLGLVAKGSVWYLVGHAHGELRTYRVSRIVDPIVMEELVVRPPDFDLERYWRESTRRFDAQLPRYYATIRASPEALTWLRYRVRSGRIAREDAPDEAGRITFVLRFDVMEEARMFALAFGDLAEVLEPLELRREVAEAAVRTADLYATRRSASSAPE